MYIIWGTGKRANEVINYLRRLKKAICREELFPFHEISFFVDSAPKSSKWEGKNVVLPCDVDWNQKDLVCIVATDKIDEIKIYATETIGAFVLNKLIDYLAFAKDLNQKLINEYRNKSFEINDAELKVRFDLCARLIDVANINGKTEALFMDYSAADIVGALYFLFFSSINELLDMLDRIDFSVLQKNKIRNVGMLCNIFSRGGAERVISNLLPIMHKHGYRTVLITERVSKSEYKIHHESHRENIKNSFGGLSIDDYLWEYSEIVGKNNLDVVCLHSPYYGTAYLYKVLLFRLMGVFVLTECHTSFDRFMRIHSEEMDYLRAYKLSDYLITLTEYECECWKSEGIKAFCIMNPYGNDRLPKLAIDYKKKRENILWIGRISNSEKNVNECVSIMKNIHKSMPEVCLSVVGAKQSVEDYNKLIELIKQNGLEKCIKVFDFTLNPEEYYKNADVMIMTSKAEGFPMVILESKAYGIPSVIYDLPNLFFASNPMGLVTVPQNNSELAAGEVIKLLIDDKYYKKMSMDARRSFEEYMEYDVGKEWKRLFSALENGKE